MLKTFVLRLRDAITTCTFRLNCELKMDAAEPLLVGVVIGGVSLLGGYVLRRLSELRAQEVSYLHQVPQFTDFAALRRHLQNSPEQRADVLVEGRVGKLGDAALVSEKSGLEGAARLVTTATYTKVYNEESGKWREMSNTVENMNASLPFKLEDPRGCSVRVEGVHTAGGFRSLLQRVFQEKRIPEQRSLGDFATNVVTLKEVPNGSLTRDYLLLFNASLAGFGSAAVLQNQSMFSSGEVVFTPSEVGHSIKGLISRNEMMASAMRVVSVILLVAGGSVLVFSLTPLLVGLVRFAREGRTLSIRDNEEAHS